MTGLFDDEPLQGHRETEVHDREAMPPPPKPRPNPAAQIVCPHCQTRGQVTVRRVRRKKGVSGGKATAGLLTMGASLLAVGLSRKEGAQNLTCGNCGMSWDVA